MSVSRSRAARLCWAGVAALAGLAMLTWSPRLPRDPYPVAAALCLLAGLVFRLRSGPLLFFGVWVFGEIRPLLPNPHGHPWVGGGAESGSTLVLAAVTLTYLFAGCQFQFLCAGVHPRRREPFEPTLPEASALAPLLRMAWTVGVRVIAAAGLLAVLQAGAEWATTTGPGYVFGPRARTGALAVEVAVLFLGMAVAAELLRFLVQERTAARCWLNDAVWAAHRRMWARIDRRTS